MALTPVKTKEGQRPEGGREGGRERVTRVLDGETENRNDGVG